MSTLMKPAYEEAEETEEDDKEWLALLLSSYSGPETPPQTLEPPPYGTRAMRCVSQKCISAKISTFHRKSKASEVNDVSERQIQAWQLKEVENTTRTSVVGNAT